MITHTSYRLEDTQFSVHTSESVSEQQTVACVRTCEFFNIKQKQYTTAVGGVHAHRLIKKEVGVSA